ncbi:AAA family ATPase [cf. Phormidesmis sp. LEGE 11477]|uniref:AAA family ATPase n=1 Tax=cf. Phormidesmis sp. LEGE 11477 TaxID=1828680 RepID=UPI00187F582B|nr:AAA family ATPase [cf. Phormidesmis sp. LEGE 11477]MBE9063026.1 AAA family ATPase [cf. Phormidesmis sp. LEGE 11477]
MTYYIAPSFLNKLAVHITKNYLDLPQVKVPLILGIHGRKGEGKTFQCELVFEQMGVEVVHISGGELESPDAGDPARLIRLRYREAAELVRVRGRMAVLMINDLDAGAGRFDRMTQYTVNTQLVNNTLMNIADNPTNVQLPGSYDEKALPRIPIVATGNDFATLYAPLIRDGRMQKFYWEPSEADRLGIVSGMFADDRLPSEDIEQLVKQFKDQAIDFFGAVRSQLYDEQITRFIDSVGLENVASKVVNAVQQPTFLKPSFQLEDLIAAGNRLVREQDRIRTMSLVNEYNQALTPTNRVSLAARPAASGLMTPPPLNPLSPYMVDRSEEQSSSSSSPWQRLREARLNQSTKNEGANSLADSITHPLDSIVALKQRLGIEHVDQRRFRNNSWQCYTTLNEPSQAEARRQVRACLNHFPKHYIRLVSIEPQTNRRIAETIVYRPKA